MKARLCPVCQCWDPKGLLCKSCGRSLDRAAEKGDTAFDQINWAAARARRAEAKRWRAEIRRVKAFATGSCCPICGWDPSSCQCTRPR